MGTAASARAAPRVEDGNLERVLLEHREQALDLAQEGLAEPRTLSLVPVVCLLASRGLRGRRGRVSA